MIGWLLRQPQILFTTLIDLEFAVLHSWSEWKLGLKTGAAMPWFKVLNPRGILNSGKKMINGIKVEIITVMKQAWKSCVNTVETELQPCYIVLE